MPAEPSISRDRFFRFGPFELSESDGELRKNGVRIKLQEQPFRVLVELVANAGKLVAREELQQKLWPADTFVDFDVGLNTAIRKLRQALGDDADHPHYIETLARRGYRFVAQASVGAAVISTEQAAATEEQKSAGRKRKETPTWWKEIRPWHLVISGIALIAFGVGIAWWRTPPAVPVVESVTQLTDDGEPKVGRLATDGPRIYFSEGSEGSFKIVQVAIIGGPISDVPTPSRIESPQIAGLTREGSALLAIAGPHQQGAVPGILWMIPLPTGEPRQLGTIEASDAEVFSDGDIAFTRFNDLYVAGKDGSNPRKLVSILGPNIVAIVEPSVSPDKRRLVFTEYSAWLKSSLFEINSDGSAVRPALNPLQNLDVCCGKWTPDGKYLLFSKSNGGIRDIYVLPLQTVFSRRSQQPVRLTNGALSYSGIIPSHDAKQILAIGTKRRGELVRYEVKSRQFLPVLSGISAIDPTFSADEKWIAYVTYPDHSLWRSRADGTERLQLTYPPLQVTYPFISPDGRRIAFSTPRGEIYVVSLDGGTPQRIVEEEAITATWSPDGNLLVVSVLGGTSPALVTYDFRSRRLSPLPSSQGLIGAQWLTQETLVALAQRPPRLVSFDLRTQKWSTLIMGGVVNWAMSPDYRYLYYTTGGRDPEALRIGVTDHKVETIVSLKYLRRVTDWTDNNTEISVAPDGSAVFTRDTGTQEIYALTVKWP